MFRIRDVLVGIRIRWSVLLDYGSGPKSCSFLQILSRCLQKIIFSSQICFAYQLPKIPYVYINLQRKQVIKKLQNFRNQGFSLFLLVHKRIWILTNNYVRIRIRNTDLNPKYRYWSAVWCGEQCLVPLCSYEKWFSVLLMNNYVKGSPIRVFNENFETIIL